MILFTSMHKTINLMGIFFYLALFFLILSRISRKMTSNQSARFVTCKWMKRWSRVGRGRIIDKIMWWWVMLGSVSVFTLLQSHQSLVSAELTIKYIWIAISESFALAFFIHAHTHTVNLSKQSIWVPAPWRLMLAGHQFPFSEMKSNNNEKCARKNTFY